MGSSRKSRPTVKSPASSFNPSFPALDEDPMARKLDGWIVDEEEHLVLDRRLEEEGKVILVLGNPSSSSIELLQSVLSFSSLLLLPPPATATSTSSSCSPPSSSSSTSRKSIVHLQASLASQGIGKVFEEALTIAAKWRKGKAKDSRRIPGGGSKEKRRSAFGLSDQTSSPVDGGGSESTRAKNRLSRPVSLMSFSSDKLFSSTATPPSSSSNTRPIDVVLNFLPSTSPLDPTSLQTLLSSTFLVTTISLPVLCPKVSHLTHASSPSPPRNRPPYNLSLSPTSPPGSPRHASGGNASANLFSVPLGFSASTPSSPSLRPLDLARSRPSSVFSNSDSNPLSLPSDAVLAHILPQSTPPLLAMLLDKFMKPQLSNYPTVGMVTLPASILASRPSIFEQEGDSSSREEEVEELEARSSEESSSSDTASSPRIRNPSQHGRSPASSPSRLPVPPIISLLLTSSLRSPLLLPPSLKPSSRRGSSGSSSSSTFSSSTLNPSSPTPSSHHLLSPTSADAITIRTHILSAQSVTFIPRLVHLPSSPSWSTGGRLLEALTLSKDGPSRSGATGYETPKLETSSSSSGSDGGIGTPEGSVHRSDATGDVSVVESSPQSRAGATLGIERSGDFGSGRRSSGNGGQNWISRFFGSFGRKTKASRGAVA